MDTETEGKVVDWLYLAEKTDYRCEHGNEPSDSKKCEQFLG